MPLIPGLSVYVVTAFLAVISPGADTLLVVKTVMQNGARAGIWTAAGICAGCAVHATLSAVGVSVLVARSRIAFDLLTLGGAAYLLWLGITALRSAVRPAPLLEEAELFTRSHTGFRDGFWVNVLNPKVSIFYLALVPQFVGDRNAVAATYAVLTGIHIAFGALWFTLLSLVLSRIRRWLLSPATRRAIDLVAGLVMLGLAVRVVLHS